MLCCCIPVDANGVDLSQFERWYSQAGSPVLDASSSYDVATKTFTLKLKQTTPGTPGQPEELKLPQVIPLEMGLLSAATGAELVPTRLLTLTESEQSFVIEGVPEVPVASLLRGFSAPVRLRYEQNDEELALIMGHDTDSFNRWDAGLRLSTKLILSISRMDMDQIASVQLPGYYIKAVTALVESSKVMLQPHSSPRSHHRINSSPHTGCGC